MTSREAPVVGPDLADVVAILERTPGTLRSLLLGLPEEWLRPTEGEGTFGPREVLGHLIHGEKTDWIPRMRVILEAGESRPFEPFDRRGFTIQGVPTEALLDEFQSLRSSSLRSLDEAALTPEALARRGRHPELGSVTLGELLATWAVHDLNHLGQVVRVMSKRYLEAVGPWKQFLGILQR
jgi:hypothetical protein